VNEETLFIHAVAIESAADRRQYLDSACANCPELRAGVEKLLMLHNDAGSFLEHPAVELTKDETVLFHDETSGSHPRRQDSSYATLAIPQADIVELNFLSPSDAPDSLGRLGPYEIQSVIGRGGMGVVFQAHDTKLNRTVAVKVLASEVAANATARKRFLREAQAAAAVSHPHVVEIHSVGDGEVPHLVMECVDGRSLARRIGESGALEVCEILRIGSQIAAGLASAHKQGLIHRDIKPDNILLENHIERVKITDFGLARAIDDLSVTCTGEIAGTPQYMSPEQAVGEAVDQRSDLFSLGSVLYTMCTGRSPFPLGGGGV
jgi:serine/threonine protein kinase